MPDFARMRSDLVVSPLEQDGQQLFTIKDPVTGNYFRLREPEYWLVTQLDGTRSPEDLASGFQAKFGFNLGADAVSAFVQSLGNLFFLEDGRSEQELEKAARRQKQQRSLAARVLFIKLKAFDPGKFLDFLTRIYRPFHNRFWFALEALLMVIGLGLLLANPSEFSVRLDHLFQVGSIILIVVALFLLISLHEFAHAVLCRYYGGRVKEMGILLLYFQPCFYSDVSDAWLFSKKSQRIAVTLAGLYFQFLFLSLALRVWSVTVPGYFINEFSRICVIVSWVTFLFNFNPLIKLDGYYLLSDWMGIPNLRSKAFAYVRNVLQRRLLGWPREALDITPREKRVYFSYGVLAFLYSAFLIAYFVLILLGYVGEQVGPAGILLLLVLAAIILRDSAASTARGVVQHVSYMKELIHRPIKLTIYLVVLAAIIYLGFFLKVPDRVSGEVSVQPMAEFTVSTSGEGLLNLNMRRGGENPEKRANVLKIVSTEVGAFNLTPIVREGQSVSAGETLAVVTSNQVTKDIATNLAELRRLEGNLALLKAPRKKEEIQEAQAQVTGAKANYDQLKKDLDRTEGLAARNMVAQEKVDAARSAVAVAKAELNTKSSYLALVKSPPRPEEIAVIEQDIDKQKMQIEYLKSQAEAQVVVTPIAGTVVFSRRPDAVFSIIDNSVIEAEVPVSDFDIKLIQTGQEASIKLYPFPDTNFAGQVVRVPRFTVEVPKGARFPVAVVIPNADGLLRQGMAGYAKISVGQTSIANLLFRRLIAMVRVRIWSWV
ncbi:MAG: HlyD family efflux transporter periplasmic adaptor subunit [Candidatus Zixiibacteriota bacterium]